MSTAEKTSWHIARMILRVFVGLAVFAAPSPALTAIRNVDCTKGETIATALTDAAQTRKLALSLWATRTSTLQWTAAGAILGRFAEAQREPRDVVRVLVTVSDSFRQMLFETDGTMTQFRVGLRAPA